MSALDVLSIDAKLRSAASAWRSWRRALAVGSGLDDDPFALALPVTGRTLFQQLAELPETDPLRRPLRRWVYRLAEQRINLPWLVQIEVLRRHARHALHVPRPGRFSLAQILNWALRDAPRRGAWLEVALARDQELVTATTLLWERRREIAVRMGLDSPDAIELPARALVGLAEKWLARTDDLARAELRRTLADLVGVALGSEASAGWPARLTPVALRELLSEERLLDGLELDPGRLPEAVASSSFLRALARVGAAWVDATAPAHQPFVVAHDPYGMRRRTHGALFALLPLNPAFARRRLGLGATKIEPHLRGVGRVVLLESRAAALRVMLRGVALQGPKAWRAVHQELVHRALGVDLPEPHPGSVWRLHADDGQRFAGLLLAAGLGEALRDEHDGDWYRNPRAIEQLRAEAALSPVTEVGEDVLERASAALSRLLTQSVT